MNFLQAFQSAACQCLIASGDGIALLSRSVNPEVFWRKLKEPLKKMGNETVTTSHGLSTTAAARRKRLAGVVYNPAPRDELSRLEGRRTVAGAPTLPKSAPKPVRRRQPKLTHAAMPEDSRSFFSAATGKPEPYDYQKRLINISAVIR